jgi:hypothetical protein
MTMPLGTNAAAYSLITQKHAQDLLLARRSEITKSTGCWITNNADSHENGYKSMNLQNTNTQMEDKVGKIGLKKAYLHCIALIADGREESLSWCTKGGGTFQVSHLCHNPGCFNPAHLLVEEQWLNKARNTCQGREIIRYSGDGPLRYNPCNHGGPGRVNVMCILPERDITEPGRFVNENTI